MVEKGNLLTLKIDDYGDNIDDASAITIGVPVTGSINYFTDADWFEFTADKTGTYNIFSTGNTDMYGELYDYNGYKLAYDDDSNGSRQFRMTTSLTAGETYYLNAHHFSILGTGAYRVEIDEPLSDIDDYGDSLSTANDINPGTNLNGEINDAGDVDWFKFTAARTGSYTVASNGNTDMYGELYNASGYRLAYDDDGNGSRQFKMKTDLQAGDTYYIKARHYNSSSGTGAYSLQVTEPPLIVDDYSDSMSGATSIVPGVSTSGEINFNGDADWFKFTAARTGTYALTSSGNTDMYGELYDTSGTKIGYDDDSNGSRQFQIKKELQAGATYYLKARQYSTGTGAYSLNITEPPVDDYSNTMSGAAIITPGVNKSGTINSSGDVDWFTFTTTRAGAYTLTSSGNTDMYGELYNADGSRLSYDDDGNGNRQFKLNTTLEANTNYYLKARHYSSSGTGDYSLQVVEPPLIVDDYSDTMGGAAELTPGINKNGEINFAGDADWFKFTATRAGSYTITSGGNTDMYGELYDSNGVRLASNDDGNSNRQFKIKTDLQAGAVYYLKARHYSTSGTGSYSLQVAEPPLVVDDYSDSMTGSAVGALTAGIAKNGVVNYANDADWFSFTPGANGNYTFTSIGNTDLYGELRDSSGNLLASDDDSAGGRQFQMTSNLSGGTTYYLKTRHYSSSGTGAYQVKVNPVAVVSNDDYSNLQSGAENLIADEAQAGVIDYAGDIDWFKFTATVQGNYSFASSGNTDMYGELYNAAGTRLASDDDSGGGNQFKISKELEAGSTYYLKAKHYSDTRTGAYQVQVISPTLEDDYSNNMSGASVVFAASTVQGEINYNEDVDWFKFTATANDTYSIISSGNTDMFGGLYNASGTLISSDDNSNGSGQFKITASLQKDQNYYIKVNEAGTNATGAYKLAISGSGTTTTPTVTHKYAILAGINDYAVINDLGGCVNDVNDIERFLTQNSVWSGTQVTKLTDSRATERNIMNAINGLASQVNAGDDVFIAFSGHGVSGSGTLCTYNFYNGEDGISTTEMRTALQNIDRNNGDGHIVLTLDSCFSGNFVDAFRGQGNDYEIFASSSSTETSADLGYNGLFTYYFAEQGITNGHGDTNSDNKIFARELFNYVNDNTSSSQHPQLFDGSGGNYIIARV